VMRMGEEGARQARTMSWSNAVAQLLL